VAMGTEQEFEAPAPLPDHVSVQKLLWTHNNDLESSGKSLNTSNKLHVDFWYPRWSLGNIAYWGPREMVIRK
jgi:hypothetical protein